MKTYAQSESDTLKPQIKTWHLLAAEGSLYAGSMLLLNEAWYKGYPRSSFHWFNDNGEWLQMDKIGHAYAAYQAAYQNAFLIEQTGLNRKKSVLISTGISIAAISSIELFDGYSAKWGASSGDLIANVGGAATFALQELIWKKQIFRMKFSYKPSPYASKRPEILGSNNVLRVIKDYNAQSYWLSFSLEEVTGIKEIPPWIALACGYSAGGMLGGSENPEPFDPISRYRQFLLSPDIDWQKIPTNKRYLKVLFRILNTVKIPFPTISIAKGKINYHWWQ